MTIEDAIIHGKKFLHTTMVKMLLSRITGIDTLGIPYKSIIKGDAKSYSIGAASIIAKVTRDRIMREWDKVYPEYGFAGHKGYGTAKHIEAIKKYGLTPIHRKTFCKNFVISKQMWYNINVCILILRKDDKNGRK